VAHAAPENLFIWSGEYLDKKQGAIYFSLDFSKFSAADDLGSQFELRLFNVLKKKLYRIKDDPGDYEPGEAPVIWKIPAGKYLVASLKIRLRNGKTLVWKAGKDKKRLLLVKKISITNAGKWSVSYNKNSGLGIKFSMIPNRYKHNGRKEDATVAAVFNGFNGRVQQVVGGKALVDKAKKNYERAGELSVRTRAVRNISMRWTIDLLRDRGLVGKINDVILAQDPYLRKCYTDRLEESSGLRGKIVYGFVLNKASGTFKKVRNIGGTINDHQLVNCVQDVLLQMQFAVPKTLLGKLIFEFAAFY